MGAGSHRLSSIRVQVVLGFGLILALALAIAVIGYRSLNRLRAEAEETLNEAARVRELSLEVENDFLLARQSENDFLSNWRSLGLEAATEKHVTDIQGHLSSAHQNIDEMAALIEQSRDAELRGSLGELQELHPLLDQYEQAFLTTVDLIDARSSQADGLEQELQAQWDQLAAETDALSDREYYETILALRAAEQAYFSTHHQQYIDITRLLQFEFEALLASAPPEGAAAGDLAARLDAHIGTFNQLVRLDEDINTNTLLFRDITIDINRITRELGRSGETALTRAREELETVIRQSVLALIATALIAIGAAVATSVLLARRIISPLQNLTRAADEIGRGNLNMQVPITGRDEFGTLAGLFNAMTAELRTMIENLENKNAQLELSEQTARVASAQAREANRLKSEFLATMSHELRTPLTAMLGFSEVMLASAGGVDPEARRTMDRIHGNSHRLLNLIDDVLNLSRVEATRVEVMPHPFSPARLLDSQSSQMGALASRKGLKFHAELDPSLPDPLMGDESLISRVIANLLSNAIKFTQEGSVTLRLASATNHQWLISVADTGAGIPEHARETIFDPFRQLDGSPSGVYGGSGLGLAVVRELVRAMGGHITLESEVGRGSAFTVILPMHMEPSPAPDSSPHLELTA